MSRPTIVPLRIALRCLLAGAITVGCRGDDEAPDAEATDSAAIDSMRIGPVDSAESAFLTWWMPRARRVALHLAGEDTAAPVATLSRYALAGGDTLARANGVVVLDLVRQNATLPDSPGTFQVYAFPEWEQQLRLWVPEDSEHCATQQAALVLGDAAPARFPLNPLCPAANVPYDIDGVGLRVYYPRADGSPWIEVTYEGQPCAPIYLFRWFADREAVELVHAVTSCDEVPR
jgi:hypothetical protein